MSTTNKPWRALGVGLLCAMLLAPVPQKASAGLVEYAIILVLIAVYVADLPPELPPGSHVLVDQLEVAVKGARDANQLGDSKTEASRLSKAIGAAEALMGMTSACNDCGEVRSTLQQIIGIAAGLKTAAVGASGSCHPNASIQPNEQCDPLAIPTGCPVAIELSYCSDECRCVPVP